MLIVAVLYGVGTRRKVLLLLLVVRLDDYWGCVGDRLVVVRQNDSLLGPSSRFVIAGMVMRR